MALLYNIICTSRVRIIIWSRRSSRRPARLGGPVPANRVRFFLRPKGPEQKNNTSTPPTTTTANDAADNLSFHVRVACHRINSSTWPREGILVGIIVRRRGNCQHACTGSQNYYSERETRQEQHARATCSHRDFHHNNII